MSFPVRSAHTVYIHHIKEDDCSGLNGLQTSLFRSPSRLYFSWKTLLIERRKSLFAAVRSRVTDELSDSFWWHLPLFHSIFLSFAAFKRIHLSLICGASDTRIA
ncbi:hypothetical protein TNCV_1254721 [Trichonephila clavipes]|nr:hypothetical protein TNCV_1254721 [Trichonephila clavipes]